MSIGEQIIAAVENQVHVVDPFGTVFDSERHLVWNKNAAEQIEAVVEAHIEERVRVRLEFDRQSEREKTDLKIRLMKTLDNATDELTSKDRLNIQKYIDEKYPDVAPPYPEPPTD